MVAGLVHKSYGRTQEYESDGWGVRLMVQAGYNPEALLTVMDVLESASPGAAGPEFMSTHPRPANRKEYILDIIAQHFAERQIDGPRQ